MTQKEVLRNIINSITHEMRVFDFEPSYKDQGFIKKKSDALILYQLLIYNRTVIETGEKGFKIEPYLWINVMEIEKYYKEITLNQELKNDADFVTIGNSIAALVANPDGIYRYRNKSMDLFVFDEKDINFVGTQLLKHFREIALPYSIANSSIAMVDKLINTKPEEYKVHTQNDNYRILKGIIAAKLNKNPLISELIDVYDRQLVERNMLGTTKEEMKRLKSIFPMIGSNITY